MILSQEMLAEERQWRERQEQKDAVRTAREEREHKRTVRVLAVTAVVTLLGGIALAFATYFVVSRQIREMRRISQDAAVRESGPGHVVVSSEIE